MKGLKFLSILFMLPLFCFIQIKPAAAYVEHKKAIVRVMNKAAGKVQTIILPVGQTSQYENLEMTVRTCKQTDPFYAENFFTFIEIAKSDTGLIFSGWMDRNEPGLNPLQNEDYDVWLMGCE